ncbi:type IV conjugative transfer system lipoprotein TraV [Acinetobacter sp. ANC 5380]|uniref:Type IV conjugative transfer system lipoprotein TraV n=1 Tax=Acinetobacter terrae TaxID=2731247 RepID=A0A7Y2RI50_9GAMM|nr:type IV conjugative transfer system lipoprotein TraV [Acinetobacter terrae]NNH79200.1 type IV conjugative transfer system lipoprotein TraV [Acinetobacter terrae]
MKKQGLLISAAFSLLMTGCATYETKYGCSGVPDGVVCKTPMQIYEQTSGDGNVGVYQENLETVSKSKYANKKPETQAEQMVNVFSKPQFQAASSPMPILEQPKVLRIWIAPWKDENDTLNWASYLFKETTSRKWNFGDSVMRNTPVTAPNQADYASPSVNMNGSSDQVSNDANDQAGKIMNQQANQVNSNTEAQKMDYGSKLRN